MDDATFHLIRERIGEPGFAAEVLKIATLAESDLDTCLCLYFSAPGKHLTFIELVCGPMGYDGKVRLLEKIPGRKGLKSRMLALTTLRRIQRIRNLVAHPTFFMPHSKIRQLENDPEIISIFRTSTDRLSETLRDCRRGLYHLSRSKEWIHDDRSASVPSSVDIFIERWRKAMNA
jgi:hypothetical protein